MVHVASPQNDPPLGPRGLEAIADYSLRLNSDRGWALSEGSRFFEGSSSVQAALERLTQRVAELEIPYAIVGGMALFQHGYRRFTEVIEMLVTAEGLDAIHQHLNGRGYLRPFEGSRNLRETETGVRIEFLTTGGFPGDGKPKPVAFPDPLAVSEIHEGMSVITLPALVDLKLASGMSSRSRLKDLADVQELIKVLQLPESFADQLHPHVAAEFRELWSASQS
ncbi:hypothetical protein [Planctomicrobium piriforme]|uniref:Uncharacterized protein n=1 Tax=Planctomicrobium piriforme TaxID=1576369 RepID=A0A1I3M007_9PLAN|nr:hypothetical protein [Planctomicrobium piriforme]SFI90120.1 hypothetical protein SAMN05421753_113114 [Planctomicrobium piriforme]